VVVAMIGYMSIDEQVDADFARARRKAALRRLVTRLRRNPTSGRLPCFEEDRRKLGAVGGVRLGRRTVSSTDIVGSVGRCSEFDASFLPVRESARTKWERIDRAFHSGEELPPVSLYKIGDSYFVHDGDHRVSVARLLVPWAATGGQPYHAFTEETDVRRRIDAILERVRRGEDR
jgi:hypothetical protein